MTIKIITADQHSFPCPFMNGLLSKGWLWTNYASEKSALWGDLCSKKVVNDAKEVEFVVTVK